MAASAATLATNLSGGAIDGLAALEHGLREFDQ